MNMHGATPWAIGMGASLFDRAIPSCWCKENVCGCGCCPDCCSCPCCPGGTYCCRNCCGNGRYGCGGCCVPCCFAGCCDDIHPCLVCRKRRDFLNAMASPCDCI